MSEQTEDRILRMEFENQSFERNINNTLESLTDLDNSLAHLATSAAENLDLINSQNADMDMSQLARSIDFIASKFTNLGIIGVTALVKITNQAIDTGERMIRALSVDQISAGWDKYTQKTASVQAIVNATGKSMSEINGYLDELMWFSDETSYGFTDMTMALGMLTSAGGEVENLIPMIEGVANATALAGKGTAEFGRAMYNLNQSYSMGSLQYMDWKSLELAGVASAQLKEELIRVGEEQGKIAKGSVNIGNFSQTLSKRWADKEVMETAFGNFAKYSRQAFEMVQNGDFDTASEAYEHISESYNDVYIRAAKAAQEAKSFAEAIDATKDAVSSGWMKTFEIIFGDYEEAKRLWTDLANTLWDVFAAGSEERNEMFKEWKKHGGRTLILEGVAELWSTIVDLTAKIKEGFREIFPKTTWNDLINISVGFRQWTRTVKFSDETLENIKKTVRGLSSVLDILLMPIRALIKVFGKLTAIIGPVLDIFFKITGAIGDFATEIRNAIRSIDPFNRLIEAISGSIDKLVDGINSKLSAFKKISTTDFAEGVQQVEKSASPLEFIADKISGAFDKVIELINATGDTLYKAGQFIGGIISQIALGVVETLNALDFDTVKETINTLLYSNILVSLQTFVTSLTGITSSITESLGGFKGFGGALVETFELIQSSLQADALLKIAKATIMLSLAFLVFTTIDPEKIVNASMALSAISANLVIMANSLLPLLKTDMFFTLFGLSAVLVSMGTSIMILAGAVKMLSTIKWTDLAKGLGSLIIMMKLMVKTVSNLPVIEKSFRMASFQLITLASSILILAQAVKTLSTLGWDQLAKGLIGVGTLLAAVGVFLNKTDTLVGISAPIGLIALSTGILILAQAVNSIADVDAGKMARALTAILAMMAAMAAFSKSLSTNVNLMSIGASMIFLGAAMNVMALAVKQLSEIEPEKLGNGLLALGAGLAEVSLAAIALNKTGGASMASSASMVVLATSMLILAKAVSVFAEFNWDQVGRAMLMLGSSLAILALGLHAMNGTLAGSGALVVAAAALTMLAGPLAIFSTFDLKGFGMSMLMLAGIFVTFGVAALVLGPIVPVLYSLAGALALFGAGVALTGAGLTAIGAGIMSIAAALAVGSVSIMDFIDMFIQLIPSILESIGKGITKIAQTLVDAIPVFTQLIIEAGNAAIDIFLDLAPRIIEALADFLFVIAEQLPRFIEAGYQIITGLFKGMTEKLPEMISLGVDFVAAFIKGLIDKKTAIINAAFDFAISFINDLARAFAENGGALLEAIFNLGVGIITGLIDGITRIVPKLWEMIKDVGKNIIDTLKNTIVKKAGELKDAIVNTVKNMWKGVTDFFEIHSPSKKAERTAGQVMEGFILGIEGSDTGLSESARAVLNHFMQEFDKGVPVFKTMGADLMNSLSSGINDEIDKQLAALDEQEKLIKEEEERLQKQEETKEKLREALLRANKAAREGDKYFDNGQAIQNYMKELGRGIAESEEEIQKTPLELINEERARLNAAKAALQKELDDRATADYLKELDEALNKEATDTKLWDKLAKEAGTETAKTLSKTVRANKPVISAAMDEVVEAVDKTPQMKKAGISMAQGVANGIITESGTVVNAAVDMVVRSIQAAKDAAEIASPSKAFRLIGYFMDKGLAIGISENSDMAEKSSRYLGESTLKAISRTLSEESDLLDSSLDLSPVITPVLDLDNVMSAWNSMNFNDALIGARISANKINDLALKEHDGGAQTVINNNSFAFNQTNNSPKELSRLDIYRQTKNQFAMFKQEVLNGVPTGYSS